jgi:hypothetical protein
MFQRGKVMLREDEKGMQNFSGEFCCDNLSEGDHLKDDTEAGG